MPGGVSVASAVFGIALVLVACGAPSGGTASPPARSSTPTSEPSAAGDAGSVGLCLPEAKDPSPCAADCDRGIGFACAALALRMERGDRVPRDVPRAATLHERACELRDPASCVAAARMHASGMGVSPDRKKQIELLVAACKLGESSACAVPAKAFASGNGVPRDPQRARELWERACTGGIELACDTLQDGGSP